MQAVIVSIGTELLIGTTLNTHGQYLSQTLNAIGISVLCHLTVGDNNDRIKECIAFAENAGDLIVLTGGLGPTLDDLSRYALADHLGIQCHRDAAVVQQLEGFFTKIGRSMTPNNLRQADFPEGAILLDNNHGTAKGFLLNHGSKTYVALPGPPNELRRMVEDALLPKLISQQVIYSQFLRVYGIGESALETRIEDLIDRQDQVTLAPYVGHDDVALRLTTLCPSPELGESLMSPLINQLKERLGLNLFSTGNQTLAESVIETLIKKNITLSLAESCSGGLLASKLTAVSGASQGFTQGFVTYSNAAKVNVLGVNKRTLEAYGAVSEETALEMLRGLKSVTGTNAGIITTGIAGPSGGSLDKPVGTVYIGVYVGDKEQVYRFQLWGDRQRIQNRTANHGLFILYHLLENREIGVDIL